MCFLGILKSAQHKCYWEACTTYWNYQGFLYDWLDLLTFPMAWGTWRTEKVAGLLFAREKSVPRLTLWFT